MINVSINDFKHPCYVVRDEITIAAVESFGFKYVPNNANLNEKENKKAFFLENNYQVYHWSRHKKDFFPKKYKDFSIFELADDGWNAKHNYRYHTDIRKSYHPYIKIHHNLYIRFRSLEEISLTYKELEDFANGDYAHADEGSIATDILEKINEIRRNPIKIKEIENNRKEELEDERKKDEELYLAEMKKKGRKNLDIINAYRKKYGIEDKTPKRKEVNELRIRKK